MKSNSERTIEILDRAGFVFLFIFAASLTTSIFVNQIGYFGALLILLTRFLVQKKFEKQSTGLEVFFILLILSEVISAILSQNSAQAFHNTFKRAILLPVVYMPIYYLRNEKRFKRIVYAFLIFAVLGMAVYLFFAYQYYIYQLYSKELKGPSIFQYVMTAGGLMSIVTIILVGFLFLKDNKLRYKIILIIAILISTGSLISSYTRAAWLGTIAGVVVLFLLHKRWVFVGAIAVLVGVFFSLTQTTSQIASFKINPSQKSIEQLHILNSKGRANGLDTLKGEFFVADYEAGITRWKMLDTTFLFTGQLHTPSPARAIASRDTLLFALLLDSRVLILNPEDDSIQIISSIIPQNVVRSILVHKNYIFMSEGEYGFEVIDVSNPAKPVYVTSFSLSNGKSKIVFIGFEAKDNYLYALIDDKKFLVFDISDISNIRLIDEIKTESVPASLHIDGNLLAIGDGTKGIKIYDISNPSKPKVIRGIQTKVLANTIRFYGDDIIFTDFGGKIYLINIHGNVFELHKFSEKISGLIRQNDKWTATYFYRSRLSSIYDPYHPSNIERMNQIKVAFRIFSNYPIFGVGNIDFNELYKKYREPYDKYTYGHLHNNYTHILATLGIFGFIIFILLLIKIFFIHIETIKLSQNKNFYNVLAKGLLAAFIGICTSGLFEYNFGDHEIATMLWFTVGLSLTIQKLMKD
ncbi:MAG: O-antigen ligase family protein [Ignavibacteria bacterium]|jgi:O-antigen ligase|nr:O-antigen ligase family protein [Ignavibacteria bacterium]MDH7527951.1 O-antigen ligase family protein [Ignavibacteria bacterium]